MQIERRQLRKNYPIAGLKALGEAVRQSRLRLKPDWIPMVLPAHIDAQTQQKLIGKERQAWSQELLVIIINREFGLVGESECTRSHIRSLEEPRDRCRLPRADLLHYIGSLELVRTLDRKFYYSSFGLDLVGQGLIEWRTGEYLSTKAEEQVLAQQAIADGQQWLKLAAQVQ